MASTRDILRRIKSVKNTKKITKAMELVAASKMRKAVESVLATRSYANLSWLTVLNLAAAGEKNKNLHKLLDDRTDVKKIGIIVLTSNRGLCGGFNNNIINKVMHSLHKYSEQEAEFILLGKKGRFLYSRFNQVLAAEFDKNDANNQVREVIPAAKMVIDDYLAGKYDKIFLAYTDYISSIKQIPRIKQLLPIRLDQPEEYLGAIEFGAKLEHEKNVKDMMQQKQTKYFNNILYKFEPNAEEVLNEMIPRLLEIQMFQALLESNASEHSARMMAMRNASDAADEMIQDLTLSYNKARQTGITAEIAEIAGGAQSLQN